MNANELANELEHYLNGEEYDRLVWEIPDLIRQQQAEIESLKKENGQLEFMVGYLEQEVFELKAQEK